MNHKKGCRCAWCIKSPSTLDNLDEDIEWIKFCSDDENEYENRVN